MELMCFFFLEPANDSPAGQARDWTRGRGTILIRYVGQICRLNLYAFNTTQCTKPPQPQAAYRDRICLCIQHRAPTTI